MKWSKAQSIDGVAILPMQQPAKLIEAKTFAFPLMVNIDLILKGEVIRSEEIRYNSVAQRDHRATLPHFFRFPMTKVDSLRVMCPMTHQQEYAQFGLAECYVFSDHNNIAPFATITSSSQFVGAYGINTTYLSDEKTSLGLPQIGHGSDVVGYLSKPSQNANRTISLDFSWTDQQVLDEVRLFPVARLLSFAKSTAGFPRSLKVLAWSENRWVEVYNDNTELSSPGLSPVALRFPTISTDRLRLQVTKLWKPDALAAARLALSEVQFRHSGNILKAPTKLNAIGLEANRRVATFIRDRPRYWDLKGLVDGMSTDGRIIHEKDWLEQLDERGDLLLEQLELKTAIKPLSFAANRFCWRLMTGMPMYAFLSLFFLYIRAKIRHFESERKIRNQLAADLHDDLGSNLSSLSLYTQRLKRKTTGQEKIIDTQLRLISDSLTSLKEMIAFISPQITTTRSLVEVFKSIIETHSGTMEYDFSVDPSLDTLDYSPALRRHLYCFLKEVLSNAAKHSQADNIIVRLYLDDEKNVYLEISDNGKGISDEAAQSPTAFSTLKLRAKEMKADLDVTTENGCSVRLRLPK
ncbi:MAG: hypothetical protein HQL32_02460 [Planctomycetes bacterium]|nr:hypothetical protein [Planctomycetota bacterium]